MIRKNWIKLTWVLALVLLPVLLGWVYQVIMAYPDEITMVTGPPGGRFLVLSERLAKEIENKLKVKVNTVDTDGSLENLSLLQSGEADFGLYQTWSVEILRKPDADFVGEPEHMPPDEEPARVEFVANVYSQPAHFIVRLDAGITSAADLEGKTISLGLKDSGDYPMSLLLLNHFGLTETAITARYVNYDELEQGFLDATVDAAFITIGVNAPIFPKLFNAGIVDILSIPYSEALASEHAPMYEYKIPAGRYRARPPAAPASDIQTVAFGTQLLTSSDVPTGLVEGVTKLVLSEDFLKSARLGELFGDRGFAQQNPEFPIHAGAQRVYYPERNPIRNTEFVERTEGLRSFIFALLIGIFFGFQWLRNWAQRRKEHKLEKFMRRLQELEQRQVNLGRQPDGSDINRLHEALDDLASLRQDALETFSAHDLNEDRATECFIDMCGALSQKLNGKLSRQRLDRRLAKLTEAISG